MQIIALFKYAVLPDAMAKAMSLPAGARWITVHPNGRDEKGVPVMIQETAGGSGVYHVIGGAGGKLNYLKLRGVKSEKEYQSDVAQKQRDRRDAAREQKKKDKDMGIAPAKQAAKEAIDFQHREQQQKFINTVAEAVGWKQEDLAFKEEAHPGLSDAALAKARDMHHRALIEKANSVVNSQRQALLADAETREEACLGGVPLESTSPDQISVADLDPVRTEDKGFGFSTNYGERAESQGLTPEHLKAEAQQLREDKLATMTEPQRKAAIQRGETAKMVKEELQGLRPDIPDVKQPLVDAKKAVELLKAQKALQQVARKAQQAKKELKTATEVKAYVLEVGAEPDEATLNDDLMNDLRTIKTRAFLSEIGRTGADPEAVLGKHLGIGAFNSINALALAAGGDALVDRSVVDVLGVAGAAQVLSRRLKTDLGQDEFEKVADGMQAFHMHHYLTATDDALREARELQDEAKDIVLDAASTGDDFAAAQELNRRKGDALRTANAILGRTLGEMEANAALVVALKQGAKDQLQVPLGSISPEAAIKQVRAIGLQRGDYTLTAVGDERFLTVNGDGMDRLAKPVDRASLQQVRRNISIMKGALDEQDWLPKGFASRPDLAMSVKPGTAPTLAKPFDAAGPDLAESLQDYIGGRAADGDLPSAILADVQSADFFQRVGPERAEQYRHALDAIAPLKDANGQQQTAESLAPAFDKLADSFVDKHYGGERSPFNKQKINVDQTSVEALHRALSAEPAGVPAYKEVGELTPQDQGALRDFFYSNVAKEEPGAAAARKELETHAAAEPEKETEDMFGDSAINPDWQTWSQRGDELKAQADAGLNWSKYVQGMRSPEHAYSAIQDLVRSKIGNGFADAHNRLRPEAPIKLGKTTVRNNRAHLDTVDPAALEARMQKERELVDTMRERNQGRYAAGSVADKLDAAREEQAAFEQSQMGFFSSEPLVAQDGGSPADTPLGADERHTLGHEAERQIAGMMSVVGKNFKPGQPVKLWQPTMSGEGAPRQRAIKLLAENKRLALAFGVGSGKTAIGLGAFSHLHETGKAKRGMYLVPAIVQGQFSSEALRFLEPGKFNWHAQPGASRSERIAAYKNPKHHFTVMTHQSFRDDMLHLGAKHAGITEGDMRDKLAGMSKAERKDWIHGVMTKEGIDYDYLMVDEGHDLLNRAGKEKSGMANVVDAFSDRTPYYVNASGDPVKNDPSEAFDVLAKMDPARYTDREAFMRRYGADTLASKDELRREMARYIYPQKIDSGVQSHASEVKVPLTDAQHQALAEMDSNIGKARLARMGGKVDVDAMKAISPKAFDGVPADQHEALARDLQSSIGIVKDMAIRRIINDHPQGAKLEAVSQYATQRKGKPGVVFAHSRAAVEQIKQRLEADGHRVVSITGSDSAAEKERKRLMFHPESGDAQADILVASDAAATGMNVQRGQWLWQHDTPQTAKTHAQRRGRIDRVGQKNEVELADAIADHPLEQKDRARLSTKYGLRDMMTSPLDGIDDTGLAYFLQQQHQQQGALL